MQERKNAITVGISAVMLALVIRLFSAAQPQQQDQPPSVTQPSLQETETYPVMPYPTMPGKKPPEISAQEGQAVQLNDLAQYEPDVQALLLSPLSWNLQSDAPTVLIVHTHATESYTRQPGEAYIEDSDYRTLDENYNMLSIGRELAQLLRQSGIQVIHDKTLHDYPSYSGSYEHARQSIKAHLAQYPSICMVIDLHRDALDFDKDPQLTTLAQVDGQRSAQLMLVAGTDRNLEYPGWQENLALGVKLTAVLERQNPGITRPIQLRAQRFNLDLTPGSLLVEVGANGNTHDEALVAVRALAEAILELSQGANLENAPPF